MCSHDHGLVFDDHQGLAEQGELCLPLVYSSHDWTGVTRGCNSGDVDYAVIEKYL